jgi:hypothetical protein
MDDLIPVVLVYPEYCFLKLDADYPMMSSDFSILTLKKARLVLNNPEVPEKWTLTIVKYNKEFVNEAMKYRSFMNSDLNAINYLRTYVQNNTRT